ncbi:MAG: sulfite exporter TauE/SafE family protein [Anaerolineales bacterium]|nr:sulfite exporter TauE/SafE family protein [Anaerolineales bacterium]
MVNVFASANLKEMDTLVDTGFVFLYSSAGFGGATSYLIILSQFGIEPNLMASSALLLNVMVSGIAFINYIRAGHIDRRLLFLFPAASAPMSFLGGLIKISREVYFSLFVYATWQMLFPSQERPYERKGVSPPPPWLALASGAAIGLVSGMVGIGEGILLTPLVIMAGWGTPKQATSTSAGFILANSISGLLGRWQGRTLEQDTFQGVGPGAFWA